jgi:RNA polymerase sigma-70 factor (ECF subfamily)
MTHHASREAAAAPPCPKDEMLAAVPKLRGFAVSLCGRTARADDLVQEALVKAWGNLGSFQPGSNMVAWLCTILRNEFYSEFRRRRHEVGDEDGRFAARLATLPAQEGHMRLLEFRDALALLADEQREALILVGASGLSYEEAAAICGCRPKRSRKTPPARSCWCVMVVFHVIDEDVAAPRTTRRSSRLPARGKLPDRSYSR